MSMYLTKLDIGMLKKHMPQWQDLSVWVHACLLHHLSSCCLLQVAGVSQNLGLLNPPISIENQQISMNVLLDISILTCNIAIQNPP